MSIIEPVTPIRPAATNVMVRERGLSDNAINTLRMRLAHKIKIFPQVRPIHLGSRATIVDSRVADLFEICENVLALQPNLTSSGHFADHSRTSPGAVYDMLDA